MFTSCLVPEISQKIGSLWNKKDLVRDNDNRFTSRGKHSIQNVFIDHYLSKIGVDLGTQFGRKVKRKLDNFQWVSI